MNCSVSTMLTRSKCDGSTVAGILGLAYILLGGTGVFANGMTAVTFIKFKEFHSAPYYWMTAVALNDCNMMVVIGFYAGFRVLTGWTGGIVVETLVITMDHVGWYLFILYFTCLDLNRFLVICLPHGHWLAVKAQSKQLTLALLLLIFVSVFAFTFVIAIFPSGLPHPELTFVFFDSIYTFGWNTATSSGNVGSVINLSANVSVWVIQMTTQVAVLAKVIKNRSNVGRNRNITTSADDKYQIRLFIQCLGPNIYCVIMNIFFYTLPALSHHFSPWHFGMVHIMWMVNHMCNPLFYAIYNSELRNRWFRSCVHHEHFHIRHSATPAGSRNRQLRSPDEQANCLTPTPVDTLHLAVFDSYRTDKYENVNSDSRDHEREFFV